jgi:hypothetical protein
MTTAGHEDNDSDPGDVSPNDTNEQVARSHDANGSRGFPGCRLSKSEQFMSFKERVLLTLSSIAYATSSCVRVGTEESEARQKLSSITCNGLVVKNSV